MSEPWHLDKKVPIALILVLVVQTAGMVWWAATLSGQVQANTVAIGDFRSSRVSERLPVLEFQMSSINSSIARLEGKIDDFVRENRAR